MTNDPEPGFREKLNTALADLDRYISGHLTLAMSGMCDDSFKLIKATMEWGQMRRRLILDVLASMDAVVERTCLLNAHGYPELHSHNIADAGMKFPVTVDNQKDSHA